MIRLFAYYIEVYIVNSVFSSFKLVHDDGYAVRNLLVVFKQYLFAHEFCDHEFFGLVRHGVGVEDIFVRLHERKQYFKQFSYVFTLSCRNGNNLFRSAIA